MLQSFQYTEILPITTHKKFQHQVASSFYSCHCWSARINLDKSLCNASKYWCLTRDLLWRDPRICFIYSTLPLGVVKWHYSQGRLKTPCVRKFCVILNYSQRINLLVCLNIKAFIPFIMQTLRLSFIFIYITTIILPCSVI